MKNISCPRFAECVRHVKVFDQRDFGCMTGLLQPGLCPTLPFIDRLTKSPFEIVVRFLLRTNSSLLQLLLTVVANNIHPTRPTFGLQVGQFLQRVSHSLSAVST